GGQGYLTSHPSQTFKLRQVVTRWTNATGGCYRHLLQIVNFYHGRASSVIHAADDSGITAAAECSQDGRLTVVGRCKGAGRDQVLLCVFPIVVRGNDRAACIVQFKRRVL